MSIQNNPQKHVIELIGYNIGRKWAGRQSKIDLRARFETYFEDWKNNNLSKEKYEFLHKELNPASILTAESDTLNQTLDDPEIAAAMLENYRLFEKGLIGGVMSVLQSSGTRKSQEG
jgi:hypothetical protein